MSTALRNLLKDKKRIVIKIGTSTIVHSDGTMNLDRMDRIAFVLSHLMNLGKEVILVSSGSLGAGMARLELGYKPASIPEQQAISAVGQTVMMNLYSQFFAHYGYKVGQILLTRDVLTFPESRNNAVNAFEQLIQNQIIPVVNENDTISVEELDHTTRFGDNDTLSAIVLELTDADLLIMMSDIDGFYDKNPLKYDDAVKYDLVDEINQDLYEQASESSTRFGTGGMTTKLNSAAIVLKNKKQMVLTNGEDPTVIFDILQGEPYGTLFSPKNSEEDAR